MTNISQRDTVEPESDGASDFTQARQSRMMGEISVSGAREIVATYSTTVAFAFVFLGLSIWLGGTFLNTDSRMLDIHLSAPIAMVALGVVLCLVGGQFDLSVGGMATLCAYLTVGLVVNNGWSIWAVLPLVLLVGATGGAVNGFLVDRIGIHAIITTIATSSIFVGLSRVYSGGGQITAQPGTGALPEWFSGTVSSFGSFNAKAPPALVGLVSAAIAAVLIRRAIGQMRSSSLQAGRARNVAWASFGGYVAGLCLLMWATTTVWRSVPFTVVFVFGAGLALWVLLNFTVWGRELYAVGGNPEAARLAGVNVRRKTVLVFVGSGVLSGCGGMVLVAEQGSATPDMAVPFLLPAFAGAFLSTVILSKGGRFHVWGTILGVVFVAWVAQGLIVGGVNFTWTEVISGLVLVVAVAVASLSHRRAQ